MFKLIEKWDNIAWIIYNFFAVLKYVCVDQFKYKKILKKNKELKDIHKGERCFIVLNGPSIKSMDLSKLKTEKTICANYFYLSDQWQCKVQGLKILLHHIRKILPLHSPLKVYQTTKHR